MIFSGKAISVRLVEGSVARLVFDLEGASINKLSRAVLAELDAAVGAIEADSAINALIISSNKRVFMVGADVTEFLGFFALPDDKLLRWVENVQTLFSRIEDLPMPSVTAINGYALGGGCELALATDYRVMATGARIGLPEVKLGIFPGWGGTVRLSRLIGVDNALEWICTGDERDAREAMRQHVVDAVVETDRLHAAALHIVGQCLKGRLDYRKRRREKCGTLLLDQVEGMMAFESAKAMVAAKAGRHFPAPIAAVRTIQGHAAMSRDEAMKTEARGFVEMAKTTVAHNLVGLFLNHQRLKKVGKALAKQAHPVRRVAVLGAGVMGGGIAYQSACKGVPAVMKDIKGEALELGLAEAGKLLMKQVKRGKITAEGAVETLNKISSTLSYGGFGQVDLVVEAVVEDERVKASVLAEVEREVGDDCVITSNTSTISITDLAKSLQRPERFCGLHFFNPVYRMPLVEVIRGRDSSVETIATVTAYARAIGKTPIVVNDCAGFLVNRVLFPYFAGFNALVRDGVDVKRIDMVMEGFGWPMGPGYLLDVIGIDTAHHAAEVMARAYPDRMGKEFKTAIDGMYENGRYGQKSKRGFYRYEYDKRGRPQRLDDEGAATILKDVRTGTIEIGEREIVDRMMIPMCMEAVRCVEDGIVDDALDVDAGLVLGIAFPSFRGGALRYIDDMGLTAFCEHASGYSHISPIYAPTAAIRKMAESGVGALTDAMSNKYFKKDGGVE